MFVAGLGAANLYAQDSIKIEKSTKNYERFDANNDGLVGRQEYQASRLTLFVKLDKNGDETLSLEEYRDYKNPTPESAVKRAALFGKIDDNKNERISVKEWNAESARRYKRWDADVNGKVTLEEYLGKQ